MKLSRALKECIPHFGQKAHKEEVKIPPRYKNQAVYLKHGMIFTKQYDIFKEIVEYNVSRNIPLYYRDCDNWSLKN